MLNFFFITFGVGAGFVVLTFIFGEILGMVDSGAGTPAPFQPIILALFATTFGGIGLILYPIMLFWVAIIFAGLAGIFVSFIIWRLLLVPLRKFQSTTVHDRSKLVGHKALVSESILEGAYGKITYTINDKIVSGPAKAKGGSIIKKGSTVEIIAIEKASYVVEQI